MSIVDSTPLVLLLPSRPPETSASAFVAAAGRGYQPIADACTSLRVLLTCIQN
jgi:hypothetical protein